MSSTKSQQEKTASGALSTSTEVPEDIHSEGWNRHRLGFFIYLSIAEVLLILFYGLFVSYSEVATGASNETDIEESLLKLYPFFQDVNVMIFIGFGFLMSFLHKYGFSSTGYNFVIAAFSVQVAILFNGLWEKIYENSEFGHEPGHAFEEPLGINTIVLIKALFAAGSVLISMGAVLGKTNALQLVVMATFELFFFAINETVVAYLFRAVDMGGSMVVHMFGAYFGLAVSSVVSKADVRVDADGKKVIVPHKDEHSSKQSDMGAMIATLFLWMFWPSFNGALAAEDQQQRVVINTFCALAACCCAAFAAGKHFSHFFINLSIFTNVRS